MAINQDTKVTIGTAAGLFIAILSVAMWLKGELASLRADVNTMQKDQYTMSNAVEQAFRMAMANPELSVPDPRNPSVMIQVRDVRMKASP